MNLQQLRQAVNISPDNIPLLLLLGRACIDAWNFEEAETVLNKVLLLDSSNIEACECLAEIYLRKGMISQGCVVIEKVDTTSLSAQGHLTYARLLLKTGRNEQASRHYRDAVNLDPQCQTEENDREFSMFKPKQESIPDNLVKQIKTATDVAGDTDINLLLSSIEEKSRGESRITFQDVGGMIEIKEQIRMKILYPLQNAALFDAYGKKAGGGVLLYGPPGCGKTLISRAVAGEIKASFFNISIHEILDMYIGNSEKNLHELFENARSKTPAVLFIDEVDALASDRNYMKMSAGRTVINQFLSELDGVDADNSNLLVMAATNAPWHVDPAFKRPGRFERILFVPPPDLEARKAILEIYLKNKPSEKIDIHQIAQKSEGYSGADLRSLIDTALEIVLEKAMKKGSVLPLTNADISSALKKTKPSIKAWFESAKNYALFANQGGFYDDLLPYVGIKK
jgi:SpoVK/Ycf46/Vps4 family AAA+-type ATPase